MRFATRIVASPTRIARLADAGAHVARRALNALCGAAAAATLILSSFPASTQDLTPLRVVLNFQADGALNGFYHAVAKGYYREAGLDLTLDHSSGSADAISRAASGLYDIAVGDIATLTEFTVKNPDTAPRAVFLLYNRSPQSIISLKKSGIAKPADLQGRVLGIGAADAPSRMFPAFASLTKLDLDKIERRQINPRVRDSMLMGGQVDAVTGFDTTVFFNLKNNGVKYEDVNIIYYGDHGLDVYGNAILASRAALQDKRELVKKFVAASARGWRETIADPKNTIVAMRKFNEVAPFENEIERLTWIGNRIIAPASIREQGIGAFDRDRLALNLQQVSSAFGLARTLTVDEIYDSGFLPPLDQRLIK
jgi:NitT/TauT family transport system substrate-binding protein